MATTTKNGSLEDYLNGNYEDKTFTFQLVNTNHKPNFFSNVNPHTYTGGTPVRFPAQVDFPSTDRVRDAKGKVRNIRYLSGAKSIFVDEMTAEEQNNKVEPYLKIINGQIIAPGYDKCLIDFLFISNWNRDSKGKISDKPDEYFLVDRESHFKGVIDKNAAKAKAQTWCDTAPIDDIYNYAIVLFGSDFVHHSNKSGSELRVDLGNTAQLNPTKFMDEKDTDATFRKGVIINAIDKKILIKNIQNNSVAWSNNPGNPFSVAPIGIDALTHCVTATFTPDGEQIFAEILKRLKPQKKAAMIIDAASTIIEEMPEEKPKPYVVPKKEEPVDKWFKLIGSLVSKGVVREAGLWLYYGDRKWAGKKNMKSSIMNEETLLTSLKEALANVETIVA